MNSKRFFYVMLVAIALLGVGIFGAVYEGNSLLVKQSNKLLDAKLNSQVTDQQESSLVQAKKDIQKYQSLETAANQIVPQDKDQAETVREIVNIANNTGVKLGSIVFPTSTLGQKAPATGTAPSPSTDKSKPAALTQVQPVTGIKGVYVMPITIKSDDNQKPTYLDFINFLHNLEQNRRTAQVTSINILPDKSTSASSTTKQNSIIISFNLILNVYIKP